MNRRRILSLFVLVILTIMMSSCGQTAENEHLPEYCQTYAGFMSTASADMYELLSEEVGEVNHFNYLSIISEIELTFELDDPTREIDLDGIQCFQNLTSLTLIGSSFKDISEISALKNIQSISLEDTAIISISSFKNLSKVKELTISGSKSLQSVDGVEEMTKLTYLELTNNGIVNIKELDSLVNLESLILRDNEISYFPEITQLNKLVDLDVSNNNISTLGEDLNGLSNLVTFTASFNEICDLSNLDDLISLEELYLDNNDLGCNGTSPDFSSLFNAPNLTELYLNDNGLTSISDLSGKDLPLEILHIHNNELTDITPISSFTSLQELRLENNQISNIQDLSGMTNLTVIELQDNLITDFTDLLSIEGLEDVHLERNQITFIPDLAGYWPNLQSLYLSENALDEITGVRGHQSLSRLDIRRNDLDTISGLSDLPSLVEFIIYDDEDSEIESDYIVNNIRVIDDSYNNVGLTISDLEDSLRPLVLGFDLAPNGVITGSFNDVSQLYTIDLSGMDIDLIDEFSFNSNAILDIDVEDNNLTDISFLLNNPNLISINISDNPVENLTILSGENTSDLDNVEVILARDISYANDLDEAFLSLASLVNLDLTNTEFNNISNSFNGLNSLNSLTINSTEISSITNSFNNLNPTSQAYTFTLDGGFLGVIDSSFNDGVLSSIIIDNQSPIITETTITSSFNNLELTSQSGVLIDSSDFKVVLDSFNGSTFINAGLVSSNIDTITNSFVGTLVGAKSGTPETNVGGTLSFHNNNIESLDLSGLNRVYTLVLSQNKLNTVAFIDSLPELESLNLANQVPTLDVFPLTTIDGINNQPLLTSINLIGVPIEHIDGFKDIGITSFIRDFDVFDQPVYNDIQILSITPESFTGTNLDTLSLLGHELTDYSFMSNLPNLDDLSLSIDVADFSLLSTLPMRTTVTSFTLESTQNIVDFSFFDDYDSLTFIDIDSPDIIIDGFSGLSSVNLVNLENSDNITDFIDSFNGMNNLNLTGSYLDNYPLLDTINNSFHLDVNNTTTIEIDGAINIINSFDNTESILINNALETAPLFDVLSFDSVISFEFSAPNYLDYGFLDGYIDLFSVDLNTPTSDVLGLDNTAIDAVTLDGSNISNVDINIDSNADLNLSGALNININMNNSEIDFNSSTGTVNLFPTNNRVNIEGEIDNLNIDSLLTTEIGVNQGFYNTVVLDTPNLVVYEKNQGNTALDHSSITINSDVDNIGYELDANIVVVNNDNFTTGTVDSSGDVTINSVVTSLNLLVLSDDFTINNNLLETLVLQGGSSTSGNLLLNTAALQSIDSVLSNSDTIEINTSVNDVDVISDASLDIIVNNNNMTLLDVSSSGADIIVNGLQTTLQGEFIGSNVTVNNNNLQSIVLSNTSSISNELDLDNAGVISSLTLGTASIDSVRFTTVDSAITVDGVNVDNYYITGLNVANVTQNSPNSNIYLTSNELIMNIDVTIQTLEITNNFLTTLGIDTTSSITTLDLSNTSVVNAINTNGGSVGTLHLNTTATSLDVVGGNITDTNITSDTITSLTLDAGTGSIGFTSTNTGALTFDLIADTVVLDLEASTINMANSSVITNATISSSNASTFVFGISDISTVNITETANTSLSIGGTNIDTLNINTSFSVMNPTLAATTDLYVVSLATVPVTINANTEFMSVTASGEVTVNNTALNDFVGNAVGNNIYVNNEGITTLSTLVTANQFEITNSALTSVVVNSTGGIDSLRLIDVSVSTIGLPSNVDNLVVNSANVTSLTYNGSSLNIVSLDTPNLNNLDSTFYSNLFLTTNVGSLTMTGNYNDITLTANTLTTIDVSSININIGFDIEADLLGTIDIRNAFTNDGTLSLDTNNTLIDITNTASTLNLTTANTADLTVSSTTSGTFSISFPGQSIVLNAPLADISISSLGFVTDISGTVGDLDVSGDFNTTLNINLPANSVTVNGGNASLTTLNLLDSNNITFLNINGNFITNIATNDNTITNFNYTGNHPNQVIINTKATNVDYNNANTDSKLFIFGYNTNAQITSNASETTITSLEAADLVFISEYAGNHTIDATGLGNLDLTVENGVPNIDVTIGGTLTLATEFGTAFSLVVSSTDLIVDTVANTFILSGNVTNKTTISGSNLTDLTTTSFTTNTLNVDNTVLNYLEFISPTLLTALDTIENNNLETAGAQEVYEFINGNITTLTSNLTEQDFFDDFYINYYNQYEFEESQTNAIFTSFYNEDVSNGVSYMLSSAYFNYISAPVLEAYIENDSFLTVDEYVIDYVNEIELSSYTTITEILENTTYIQTDIDGFRTDITNVLNSNLLVIDTAAIDLEVIAQLESNATTSAQSDVDSITFIIS